MLKGKNHFPKMIFLFKLGTRPGASQAVQLVLSCLPGASLAVQMVLSCFPGTFLVPPGCPK